MQNFKRANIGIPEERQFTNPHVRFIRKHGRVIPIMNKKRVGQDITSAGHGMIKAGAVLSAVGLTKFVIGRTKAAKKLSNLFSRVSKAKYYRPPKSKGKLAGFTRFAMKAAKQPVKHAGKFGMGMTAAGIMATFGGAELQMRSPFGKDFFFVKDQHDRDS